MPSIIFKKYHFFKIMDQKQFEEQEKEETLATPGVFDKYQQAGKIANGMRSIL
jgi:hypothetical protein